MAGKRHRGIRRTVSISTMGSGSNISESSPLPEVPNLKQKAPVFPSYSPRPSFASNYASKHPAKPPLIDIDALLGTTAAPSQVPLNVKNPASKHPAQQPLIDIDALLAKATALSQPASSKIKEAKTAAPPQTTTSVQKYASKHPAKQPLIDIDAVLAKVKAPSQPPSNIKDSEKPHTTLRSSGWDKSERKCVGLGVVAALSNENDASTGAKDGKTEAPPPIVSKNIVTSHVAKQPVPLELSQYRGIDMQRPPAIFLHEWNCNDDYDHFVCPTLPTANFLEACYLCNRQLSHGRDIYMYRGDQAFCSEECRYEQIVSDERKEKCALEAIKMRTSSSPVQSPNQRNRRATSGAAAAG